MSEHASLARPYVRAVFDIAKAAGDLSGWSEQLGVIAAIAGDPQIRALDGHPRIGRDQLADLVIGVAGDRLTEQGRSLVKLLAHNRRLVVAGEISDQFEVLKAEAENSIEAELESATDLDDSQRESIAKALESRLGRSVKLNCKTNPELLGGAVIRTGDWVYDGSVLAQLKKMTAALNA
jgi:F-type H+-transporting ATPase subunit delta